MKTTSTISVRKLINLILTLSLVLVKMTASGQVTPFLGDPTKYIYGLTDIGEILEIDAATGITFRTIKNNVYAGNAAVNSNALAYSPVSGKFYYFKRNIDAPPQEFVSFDPGTNTVSILASSTCFGRTVIGCASQDGKGYYSIDIFGSLNYYSILTNTWTVITSSIKDQFGNSITAFISGGMTNGDMAIDGYGNIWLVTSGISNYALYKIPAPLPVSPVPQLFVSQVIAPRATPTMNAFAGIAFDANGQIFMSTRNSNELYLLQNSSTLSFVAYLSTNWAGGDLTSQNFPFHTVLPVKWESFTVGVQNGNHVNLNWEVNEFQNKGFYVQHSLDGNNWEDISFIPSNNISETLQNYSYSYINNLNGAQYYRIKQVDLDRKESFTEVRTIHLKNERSNIAVWPNPATDHISIVNDGTKQNLYTKARIVDLSGRLMVEKALQPGMNTINMHHISSGIYYVEVQNNNGKSSTQKILKL